MAKVHVVCPFCNKHLETASSNEGHQGQCPYCENVFDVHTIGGTISRAHAAYSGLERRHRPQMPIEYSDKVIVLLAAGLAALLAVLAGSALLGWASLPGTAQAFVDGERAAVMAGSLACAAFLAISLLGRRSMAPPVLVSGAWGMTAAIWIGGLMVSIRNAGAEGTAPLQKGIYPALALACLALALGAYLAFQFRGGQVFRNLGMFLVATQMLAIVAGVLAVAMHVRPALKTEGAPAETAQEPPSGGAKPPGRPAGADPGRRAQTPPSGRRPTPEPAKVVREHIWVEGEATDDSQYVKNDTFHIVNGRMLSNWDWATHYDNRKASATWRFEAKQGGKYTFWLRCVVDGVAQSYELNEGKRTTIKSDERGDEGTDIARPGANARMLYWIKVREVDLRPGDNFITIEQRGGAHNSGGIDCMCFVNFEWQPDGSEKPED